MTNQEKQAALLKDLKKVLNDHGAELFAQISLNKGTLIAGAFIGSVGEAFELGASIDGTPVKDLEWYKERAESLEKENVNQKIEIHNLKQALTTFD